MGLLNGSDLAPDKVRVGEGHAQPIDIVGLREAFFRHGPGCAGPPDSFTSVTTRDLVSRKTNVRAELTNVSSHPRFGSVETKALSTIVSMGNRTWRSVWDFEISLG
jgi:hypothetical protein